MIAMSSVKCITLEEEMKKNSELKISDIEILREWCEKQPHLPKIQDVQLAIFLHSNYYQTESTKSTIENYYTTRTNMPEFFSNRDAFRVKELREVYKVLALLNLEEKTKEGYIILITRLLDFEPSHFIFNDAIKCNFMMSDQCIWTQGSTPGYIGILDVAGLKFGHIRRLNIATLKKVIHYIQDALPIRLLAIHVINTSPIIQIVFNAVKMFLKPEMIDLIHFHSSIENVSKYFPIDALPNEYGGKAGDIQELVEIQLKKIEDFHEWYLEDEKINRVDESLRIRKNETSIFSAWF